MAENSSSVGPMKSETEADCISATGGAHVLSDFTKKKGEQQHAIFSNVTRATETPFSNYSKHLQLISALHITGNHEFWYCSRSRLLHNSSKTTGSNQNAWEMGKCDRKPITMPIPIPKGLREYLPQPRPVRKLLSLC